MASVRCAPLSIHEIRRASLVSSTWNIPARGSICVRLVMIRGQQDKGRWWGMIPILARSPSARPWTPCISCKLGPRLVKSARTPRRENRRPNALVSG